MNVALRQRMSLAEFLAWEERQELRYEFDGLQPVAMVGVTRAHATIQGNLLLQLGNRLRGSSCRPFASDLKVEVAGGIRYPDVFVVCTPGAGGQTVIADPVVVFEILSPSTALTDHMVKNAEYRATPSVQRYVMLEQDSQAATVFAREGDRWVGSLHTGDAAQPASEASA